MFSKARLNWAGVVVFSLVVVMILIRMAQAKVPSSTSLSPVLYRLIAAISDPYVLLSTVPYIFVSIFLSRRLGSTSYTKRRLSRREHSRYQNTFVGAHIAFVLLILGLLLGLGHILWRIIYYVIAIAAGMLTSFLVIAYDDREDITTVDELEF